ncbi:MAG: AAA family ATPase [Nostocales cyanobacterium ELA583]|jgi:predicted ATPase/signal transduction histidine kinase
MVNLIGYQIGKEIFSSSEILLYQGTRQEDKLAVVIKILRSEYPSFQKLVQFRNEYIIGKNLNIQGVIKIYSLENYQNGYALVMEDFNGISLQEEMQQWKDGGMGKNAEGLKRFFDIAIQIVSILKELYQQQVIHKDIRPANIFINPSTLEIKLIDFSIASLLSRETLTLTSPQVLEGTLSYLSPEQTGRINRVVDYRTDFYSLGITFFELLTGELPFVSNDPIDLIYYHIAKQPPLVTSINSNVPPVLSAIISKLMAKNAEYRYQSAQGIKYDLERCIQSIQDTGKVPNFELGTRDICDRLIIPEKLYGRQVEVETLLTAFQRVCANTKEMILVAGYSGIGKTAVVNEVHKPIVKARGYFIKGKFDQFQRNIPFFAFIQAFTDLIDQILTESDTQLQAWETKILAALGENAQVIIAVIPELEKIIGKQPPVPELSSSATENLFNSLFAKFIQIFTTQEHPLVMFLDDLQWADLASLKLMQLLMTTTDTSYLLLIGAYRDNEVSTTHPLMLTLEKIRKAESIVNTITLCPLNQFDLNQLILDTLHCPHTVALPFTELVYLKTQGNPFFSNQFIRTLYEDSLITFNFHCSYWQCDISKIQALTITDNVVEFMALQLQKLPESTQSLLKLAACIGNQFDLSTLAKINEKSQSETAADLWKALPKEFIIPTTKIYKFFQSEAIDNEELCAIHNYQEQRFIYRFLHDRVQQAAYSLIPEHEKKSTHLKIGQLLLNNTPQVEIEEHIFEIVNQFNIGAELITNQLEKYALAELNLIAGYKAKSATAYDAACKYLKMGLTLLSADNWQNQYNLTLNLYVEAAEIAYLNIDHDQAITYIEIVKENATNILDKIKVYKTQMLICDQMQVNVNTGIELIEILGVSLQKVPPANINIEDLIHLPKMTDPHKLAAMDILLSLIVPTSFFDQELQLSVIFTIIYLSIHYGNSAESAYGYVYYAYLLCNSLSDINTGYSYGKLALNLSDKFENINIRCKVKSTWYAHIGYWQEHFRKSILPLQENIQDSLAIGELKNAGGCCFYHILMLLFSGNNLIDISEYLDQYITLMISQNQWWMTESLTAWKQMIFNIINVNNEQDSFNNDFINEEFLVLLFNRKNNNSLFGFYLTKTIQYYLFKQHKNAIDNAILCQQYITSVVGITLTNQYNFYHSLALLAAYPHQSKNEQLEYIKQVTVNQEKMRNWAINAPMNYQHKYDLVEAEKARVLGEILLAMEYYDQAIQSANQYEYVHEEALAYELAAEFYLSLGRNQFALLYITKAYYSYLRWGAKAKLDHLEKSYPQLLTAITQQGNTNVISHVKTSLSIDNSLSTIVSSNHISTAFDLNTVVKSSQVIASEIELDKLLSTLMQVIMENSGADKSALILVKNQSLFVEVIATPETIIQPSIPVELSPDIPISVINYVYHTAKILLIDDAEASKLILSDSYIISQQPKSLLCIPIINQGAFIGILYLENKLILGAFTYNRIEILKLLITQAAISLKNADLYTNLLEKKENLKQINHQLEEYAISLKLTNRLQKLADLSIAINLTLSINDILRLITDQASEIIGAHQTIISLTVDENWANVIHTVHLSDKYTQWQEDYQKPDKSSFYLLGCQIQNSMRMTQTEVEAHPAAANNHLPLRGWLAAPLININGKNIGLIQLSDKYEGDFTEDDEAILVQLAQMALSAINNAHLYEESQKSNRMKDEFLAILSHELRTPLTSIVGWSQMLRSGKLSAGKTIMAIDTIESNAKAQTQLIEDIVDISRIIRGTISLKIQPINLTVPINIALNTLHLSAEAKSIQILSTIESSDAIVLGDWNRLQQIISNLISNAIKFTPPEGKVEIKLKTRESEAEIQVIDTGIGISSDFMPYIFDQFRQADASSTRSHGGLGLGLTIVHHLVKLHGGTVGVHSLGTGEGTTFTVRIPLQPQQPTINQVSKSLKNTPNIKGIKILLVDDNADIRDFLIFALQEDEAVVMAATSVREALQHLEEFKPDILISDIGMPQEDGYDLLRQIRALASTQMRKIPAIALTGYNSNEVGNQIFQAGFQKHITKPVEISELIAVILSLLP